MEELADFCARQDNVISYSVPELTAQLRTREKQLTAQIAECKKLKKELAEARESNDILAQQCKTHYDNCQKLMRHELHIEEKVHRVQGIISGTNEKFSL
jgi:hypothetical protein